MSASIQNVASLFIEQRKGERNMKMMNNVKMNGNSSTKLIERSIDFKFAAHTLYERL